MCNLQRAITTLVEIFLTLGVYSVKKKSIVH